MKFDFCIKSDIGPVRNSNQDSAFADAVRTRKGKAFFGMVCDGMGGLSDGEFASKTVVELFKTWFEDEFEIVVAKPEFYNILRVQWSEMMNKSHDIFIEHIGNTGKTMGTTLSALLIIDGKFYAAQVGDSRIYLFRDNTAFQITSDHSYVAELAEKGLMTFDEANVAENKNILTRCIGNMSEFSPDFYSGEVFVGDCFSISSDGFHGGLIASEMNGILAEIFSDSGRKIQKKLDEVVARKIFGGEKDNITAVCVKCI